MLLMIGQELDKSVCRKWQAQQNTEFIWPSGILPCVMHSGYACLCVLWTDWGMWHACYSPLKFILHREPFSYFVPSTVYCLAVDTDVTHLPQRVLCSASLQQIRGCAHRKQDPSLLVTKVLMWCHCQTCKFCDGGRERQQFSSATESKGLWMCTVVWEHRGFTLVGVKAGNHLWVPFPGWRCGSHFHSAVKNTRRYQRTVHQQKGTWISFLPPKLHPYTAGNQHFHLQKQHWAGLEKETGSGILQTQKRILEESPWFSQGSTVTVITLK